MSILYDPKDRGFPEALSALDRCQIAMLRELAHSTDGRLVLKGGMAMRVAVGSTPDQRDALTQARWEEMTLNVAQTVQQWVTQAMQPQAVLADPMRPQ